MTYVAPPRRSNTAKWWLIGCGGGCLLAVLLVVVLAVVAGPAVRRFAEPIYNATTESIRIAERMAAVHKAIEAYRSHKGKYPAQLGDLVPQYLADASAIRHPAGPTGKPFAYHRPAKDAGPTTVLLEYNELVVKVPGAPPQPMPIRVLLNGEVEMSGGGRTRRTRMP